MSYCRFGWGGSSVYVFQSREGFECCGCLLQETLGENVYGPHDQIGMVRHLRFHRTYGHTVPQDAIDALMVEWVEENGGAWAWRLGFAARRAWARVLHAVCRRKGHVIVTAFPKISEEIRRETGDSAVQCSRCQCFGFRCKDGIWFHCDPIKEEATS